MRKVGMVRGGGIVVGAGVAGDVARLAELRVSG